LVRQSEEFKEFKDVFVKTKHTGLTTVAAEEFFLQTYEKIEQSWTLSVEHVAKNVAGRIYEVQADILKKL
jgi:hypothetical protein